jgi:hypothetical protein
MDIFKIKSLPEAERRSILEGEQFTEEVYMQPLTDDEVAEHKSALAQACIKIKAITDEKKEIMAEFKDRLSPLEKEKGASLDAIKNRAVEVTGRIYSISDFDNQLIHQVDPNGNVLGSRRMKPEERQLSLNSSLKAS